MCAGKCSRCIAFTLYPLVLISIICNIVLFFPGSDIKYAKEGHITEEVKYMGGLIGGGLMVLIPALYISLTGEQGCCGNRCGMFLSIVFAAMGVTGGLYSFIVAVLGLGNGPLYRDGGEWTTPFKKCNSTYLTDFKSWGDCTEPKNVVQFNIGLFITLTAASCLQLCAIQMINGLFGCLCGTCNDKEVKRTIQGELKVKIREAKERYRRKLEWKLQQNNIREVWSGMRTITGYRPTNNREAECSVDRANELNLFFNRFDTVVRLDAFNTICPALPGEKLTEMQVDAPLVSWIVNYLTAIVGCICKGDEEEYRAAVDYFVA
ncbi:transmembrane 4 L6 family member 1-like [Enoplosus armatus]|uniref:transmembrane 4 L6 family member 1-like n=1 Tax=Enoplosus armatus TaxID=215367 RepID=UPI00399172AE